MLEARGRGLTSQRARDRLVGQLRAMGIASREVLEAIGSVPRHLFVDEALASRAYENTALPIGHGQTISQPYIVARMSEALVSTGPMQRVLELGAGCGYQTAVLALLAEAVYSIERIAALVARLRGRMGALGYRNVQVRHSDGHRGWPRYAPYDAMLVAAATPTVPEALLGQLAIGGRMVIPVGTRADQQLMLITRHEGGYSEQVLEGVRFVPIIKGVL
ncbi:MAG: protein-L-isoaspartate(D-aspartate) O-methyltransferase [Gammaproteobacteria bacterium]